ncbi:MAG: PHP domain-containing protein [Bacteroidales bacterium]|nr:PHP domain-containing protein [Bacteroidales bacterium]
MNLYRADLHIHTVLSPCGDLEMSPVNIIKQAVKQKLDIIGITDHNSTLHGPLLRRLGKQNNILVLTGAEVTSREEVHCLTFFENDEILGIFQAYLEKHLPNIKNKPSVFGYQVVVDENEHILKEIKNLLIAGINQSINEIEIMVHQIGGIFIPAHVNKPANSLLGNLGFLPPDLQIDGIEITSQTNISDFRSRHPEFDSYPILRNSDAHQPEQIGSFWNNLNMESLKFEAFRQALKNGGVLQ